MQAETEEQHGAAASSGDADQPVPTGSPAQLHPDKIRKNPENPRIEFPQNKLMALAASIQQVGVLVPITVFPDDEDPDGERHVLLDGERRWTAVKLLNHDSVPAWVVPKPTGVRNALTMFNIHMLKEDWTEVAVMKALERVIEELGTDDDRVLQRETGLSRDRIRNIKLVLQFPAQYRELLLREKNPPTFHFFVELRKNVLRPAQSAPEPLQKMTEDEITDLFLKKYESGALGDIVDLRKVRDLIGTAGGEGYPGELAREALSALVSDPETSVLEAYEAGAAAGIEIRQLVNQVRGLPGRIKHVLEKELVGEHKSQLKAALSGLRDELDDFLSELEE